MKKALVGCTGFVGSNMDRCTEFEGRYHSTDICEAYDTHPDLLVYAGVSAEKFLANVQPEKDFEIVKQAFDNICRIDPKQLILISTADVYKIPSSVDESSEMITEDLHAYGLNRYRLEQMVRERFPDAVIVRLPALFGKGLKKNFIYDYIHRIPPMLTTTKYEELNNKDPFVSAYYEDQNNGFWKCRQLSKEEHRELRDYFVKVGFSSLAFTDSRSSFQFYPLDRLWSDLEIILRSGRKLVNIVTEPLSVAEIYEHICGDTFINETNKGPVSYDIRTLYAEDFGVTEMPYIVDKKTVLNSLKSFVDSELASM